MDDHGLFRESLSRLLQAEPDFEIAGTCATATEALAFVEREAIDVVLLDYDLGDEQGSGFLESARQQGFRGRVLMVTAGMNDMGTLRALENGAWGIFLKHSPPSQLMDAIHKVANGEMWLDSRAVRSVVAGATGKSDEQRNSQPLTERERAVLKGVFEGLSNKEIAVRLSTSEGSVKATMQQLFDKTGVRTRSQLVRIALERLTGEWVKSDES